MISYSWANQEAVIVIKLWLESEGYNVWLDVDMMCGSTLETMAKAVEDAECFVMAVSDAYKNSPNCRAEAEYAFQQHKFIVPIMLQSVSGPGIESGAGALH